MDLGRGWGHGDPPCGPEVPTAHGLHSWDPGPVAWRAPLHPPASPPRLPLRFLTGLRALFSESPHGCWGPLLGTPVSSELGLFCFRVAWHQSPSRESTAHEGAAKARGSRGCSQLSAAGVRSANPRHGRPGRAHGLTLSSPREGLMSRTEGWRSGGARSVGEGQLTAGGAGSRPVSSPMRHLQMPREKRFPCYSASPNMLFFSVFMHFYETFPNQETGKYFLIRRKKASHRDTDSDGFAG